MKNPIFCIEDIRNCIDSSMGFFRYFYRHFILTDSIRIMTTYSIGFLFKIS